MFTTNGNEEIPIGVSQWRNHGQKFGYWEFFEKEIKTSQKQKVLELVRGMNEPNKGSYMRENAIYNSGYRAALSDLETQIENL